MTPIQMVKPGFCDVAMLARQLEANPQLWNQHTARTLAYVHSAVSDIWVRYNAFENLGPNFNDEHESVWYPAYAALPALKDILFGVMREVEGTRLGGVLITRVPAGGEVKPHVDNSWHAGYYEKFAVQVKGNKDQAFCFEECSLSANPGDLYTFDNSKLHWVTNDSGEERITLIICIRRT